MNREALLSLLNLSKLTVFDMQLGTAVMLSNETEHKYVMCSADMKICHYKMRGNYYTEYTH